MVADRVLDQPCRFGRGQPVLGLTLELRIADENREHDFGTHHDIVGGQVLRLLRAGQLAEGAQGLGQRSAQALFVRPAVGGGHGVAIPAGRPVRIERPGDRPFDAPGLIGKILRAGKGLRGDAFATAELFGQVVRKAAGEFEHRFGGDIVAGQAGGAFPADFDPGEEIGFRARQLEQLLRIELPVAENLGVGHEADRGSAAVGGRAELFDRPERFPA